MEKQDLWKKNSSRATEIIQIGYVYILLPYSKIKRYVCICIIQIIHKMFKFRLLVLSCLEIDLQYIIVLFTFLLLPQITDFLPF